MNIHSVTIKNFKKFEDCYIEFQPGFNLIIGEPDAGKTSVLDALAVGLSGFTTGMNSVIARNIRNSEIRRDFTKSIEQYLPVQINIDAEIDGEPISWTRERKYLKSARSATTPLEVPNSAHDRALNLSSPLPILCYYTSRRLWNYKTFDFDKYSHYDREDGYEDSLTEAANIKLLFRYFDYMENIRDSRSTPIPEYECVKSVIIDFMNMMYDTNIRDIHYNSIDTSLNFLEGENRVPSHMLSDEMKYCMYLVADISCRMAILNPFLIDELNSLTAGVVLIDELELHVSVKNQWKLINLLCKFFPNVQFIATTSSPILLASADVNVVKLYDHDVEYFRSHYGVDVNTAIRQYFGDYEFPQPIRNEIEKFFSYMDKEDYENARNLLDRLKITTSPEFPTIVEMETLYDLETADPE